MHTIQTIPAVRIETLDDLRDALQHIHDETAHLAQGERENAARQLAHAYGLPVGSDGVDYTALPVFGGEEPADCRGVWSWDETHTLEGSPSDAGGLVLCKREEDEEEEEEELDPYAHGFGLACGGSYSWGTLRTADLRAAALDALHGVSRWQESAVACGEYGNSGATYNRIVRTLQAASVTLDEVESRMDPADDTEREEDYVELAEDYAELVEALESLLPPGWYWGSTEGDGADIGIRYAGSDD